MIGLFATTCPFPISGISPSETGEFCFRFRVLLFYATHLIVKCRRCGYEWNAVPANLLSGDGCKRCGIEKAHAGMVKAQEEFEAEINRINPNIQIIGSYTGRHKPVKARCRICGFEWEPQAGSLLRGSSHKGAIGMHRKMGKH